MKWVLPQILNTHTLRLTEREKEKKTEVIHCVLLPPPLCACMSACVCTCIHVCVPMWIGQDTYMNTKVCKHTRQCPFEYLLQSHNMLWPAATAYIPGKSPATISERGQQCLVCATWLDKFIHQSHPQTVQTCTGKKGWNREEELTPGKTGGGGGGGGALPPWLKPGKLGHAHGLGDTLLFLPPLWLAELCREATLSV